MFRNLFCFKISKNVVSSTEAKDIVYMTVMTHCRVVNNSETSKNRTLGSLAPYYGVYDIFVYNIYIHILFIIFIENSDTKEV